MSVHYQAGFRRFNWYAMRPICAFVLLILAATVSVGATLNEHIGLQDSVDPADCLSCHDGLLGEHPMNHPFNVNYRDARQNHRSADLKSPQELPSAIRLVDDRVVCVSCHDMNSTLPNNLVLSMERSELCIACHKR